jgi:uncharacterized alpha-E superfamily protein
MLSRAADSLFWLARYIERAEDTARLLDVEFHGLLDRHAADPENAWREFLRTLGKQDEFSEHYDEFTASAVTSYLLWHPGNPDSVTACVAAARENARSVRDQLSTEMWERINRLFLLVTDVDRAAVLPSPHRFFVRLRDGSHGFLGVTGATMERGEGYQFLRLGTHLERADMGARVLNAAFVTSDGLYADGDPSPAQMIDLLKSCSAFEAFRRQAGARLTPTRVAEYLLLDRVFPRAVLYCLDTCLEVVRAVSGTSRGPERTVGRLCAELAFHDVFDVTADPFRQMLARVQRGIVESGDEIADAYFVTRVLAPAAFAQAQQQQQ